MSFRIRTVTLALLVAAACSDSSSGIGQSTTGSLHVLNATPADVALTVDGATKGALPASVVSPDIELAAGAHQLVVSRNEGNVTRTATVFFATVAGSRVSLFAYGPWDSLSARVLGDTGTAVPADSSRLRLIHLAPGAESLEAWWTEPDTVTATRTIAPFAYSPVPSDYVEGVAGVWTVSIAPEGRPFVHLIDEAISIPGGERRTVALVDSSGVLRLRVLEE
jgi:hypothetical protein